MEGGVGGMRGPLQLLQCCQSCQLTESCTLKEHTNFMVFSEAYEPKANTYHASMTE